MVDVRHESTHHGKLLEVLLPEHRHVGLAGVEELGHHGRHSVEVPGPSGSLQWGCDPAQGDGRVEPVGVHHRVERCVHGVGTCGGCE